MYLIIFIINCNLQSLLKNKKNKIQLNSLTRVDFIAGNDHWVVKRCVLHHDSSSLLSIYNFPLINDPFTSDSPLFVSLTCTQNHSSFSPNPMALRKRMHSDAQLDISEVNRDFQSTMIKPSLYYRLNCVSGYTLLTDCLYQGIPQGPTLIKISDITAKSFQIPLRSFRLKKIWLDKGCQ